MFWMNSDGRQEGVADGLAGLCLHISCAGRLQLDFCTGLGCCRSPERFACERARVSNRGGTVLWSQEAEGHQYSIYQVVTARSEAQRTPIPFYGAGPTWNHLGNRSVELGCACEPQMRKTTALVVEQPGIDCYVPVGVTTGFVSRRIVRLHMWAGRLASFCLCGCLLQALA